MFVLLIHCKNTPVLFKRVSRGYQNTGYGDLANLNRAELLNSCELSAWIWCLQ